MAKRAYDNSGFIGTILIYLSKVYDGLPHDLINAKFEGYGLNRNSLKLIFLEGRKQRTKKGSSKEVPQGSIIGPLLFNVFISDLFMFIKNCEVCNFVDDNTLYNGGKERSIILENLKHDMKIILKWFTMLGLQFA